MNDIAADDFSWMDAPPTMVRKPKRRVKKKTRQKKIVVQSAKKLDHETIRGKAMMSAVKNKKRVWACDGQYLFFRRKSCTGVTPEGTTIVNEAVKRHDERVSAGELTHVQTQDDVEIYQVNQTSPFYRAPQYLGTMSNGDVRAAIVRAAVKRDWALYVDALTEFAGRVKGAWLAKGTLGQAELAYQEELKYIEVLIQQRFGPSPPECAAGLQNIRMRRGESQGRRVLVV